MHSHVEIVSILLRGGADANIKDGSGYTPLHCAVEHDGNVEIIRALIKAGAEVNTGDRHGRTSLHEAARNGLVEATQALIDNFGTDVNARDNEGKTALDVVQESRDRLFKDFPGKRGEIIELLKAHGAKTSEELRK
jgi:ankyrin repeat protein